MKDLTNNQNLILSTSEFLIPSSTGEYLPTNISTIYAATDLEEINEELYEFFQDNGIEILYSLNIKESHQAYNELLDQLNELLQSDFIGDDDFEDYIPDLVNQILHIILYYNHNFPENHLSLGHIKELIQEFDVKSLHRNKLQDNCNFLYTNLIEEQELIQEILKKFPNDQQ